MSSDKTAMSGAMSDMTVRNSELAARDKEWMWRHVHAPAQKPYKIPKITKPATVVTPVKAKIMMAHTPVQRTIKLTTLMYLTKKPGDSRPMQLKPFTITSYPEE